MAERITGSFPGGPTRKDTSPQREGPPRTARVEELEAARATRAVHIRQRARRRRVVWGFVLSLLIAGGVGLALGLGSHTTAEDISAQAQQTRAKDLDISKEVNRTLLELWRMEEVEAQRGQGRIR